MSKKTTKTSRLKLPEVPLLVSESRRDFQQLANALHNEIKPCGILERIFVDDIAQLTWEIIRLRRWHLATINTEFRDALADIIWKFSPPTEEPLGGLAQARDLADRWFFERDAQSEVRQRLREFGLDISAIEARAATTRADNLMRIDQLIAAREARRLKALESIALYREAFAQQLRESSDRLIEDKREIAHTTPLAVE